MDNFEQRNIKVKKILDANKAKNKKYIQKLRSMSDEELCKMFNCKPEQICRGDYNAKMTKDEVCPFVVILGCANFAGSKVKDTGNLVFVGLGTTESGLTNQGLITSNSYLINSGKVRWILGDYMMDATTKNITSFGDIEYIGGSCYVNRLPITNMGKVKEIGGVLSLDDSNVTTLEGLEKVGVIYGRTANKLQDWGTTLKKIGEVKFNYIGISVRNNEKEIPLKIHDKFYTLFNKNSSVIYERNEIINEIGTEI